MCINHPHACMYCTDYTRCGNDSNQCVKIADICNSVVDCRNGWDETAEQCVSEVQRQMFVTEGEIYFFCACKVFVLCILHHMYAPKTTFATIVSSNRNYKYSFDSSTLPLVLTRVGR